MHPESTKEQYLTKSGEEKIVRCFQLIDPNVDLAEVWLKEEPEEDDEQGLLNNNDTPLDMPMIMYALRLIHESGPNGITQNELSTRMGTNRLNARSVCRCLVRRKGVTFFLDNQGRQRITKFISKSFVKSSQIQKVFDECEIFSANKIANKSLIADEDKKRKRNLDDEDDGEDLKSKVRRIKEAVAGSSELKKKQSEKEDCSEKVVSYDDNQITTIIERIYEIPGLKLDMTNALDHGKLFF